MDKMKLEKIWCEHHTTFLILLNYAIFLFYSNFYNISNRLVSIAENRQKKKTVENRQKAVKIRPIFPQHLDTLACKQRSCVRGVDPAAVGLKVGFNVTPNAHCLQTFVLFVCKCALGVTLPLQFPLSNLFKSRPIFCSIRPLHIRTLGLIFLAHGERNKT
jgi:hypothetical protein